MYGSTNPNRGFFQGINIIFLILFDFFIIVLISFFIFFNRYSTISARVLLEKISKAEAKVKAEYFAQGMHSKDSSGASSEAEMPPFAILWGKYFDYVDSRKPDSAADRAKRNIRRNTWQQVVGAQVRLHLH